MFLTVHRVSDTLPLLVSDATDGGCTRNLSKRAPWRHHKSDGNTDPDTDSEYATSSSCPSCSARLSSLSLIYRIGTTHWRPQHHPHHPDDEHDGDGENTYKHKSEEPWTELTSETWTEPEAEPQTESEWQSALTPTPTPTDSDSPTTPNDPNYSPSTPTDSDGDTTPTGANYAPTTPTSPPASESVPMAGPSGGSNVNSNTVYSPSSSKGSNPAPYPSSHTTSIKPTSTSRVVPHTTRSGTVTQPTAARTTSTSTASTSAASTSTTSHDMIRPNTSSSLHIVAVITITPESSPNDFNTNLGVIDPYPSPARSPFNSGSDSEQSRGSNGVVSSRPVPLGVIIGSVFGILFGGLALFCVLFGINKLRQRKQDNECELRARRLRMGGGTGSSSTVMLVRGPEASGSSQTAPGSIHTNDHGELDRGGILVREGADSPAGSGRGWIRFANQRRPSSSSLPVLPEIKDHSETPLLMQEWNSPSSVHPPKPQFMERGHSPTVPSPLRTHRVTPSGGWI